MAKNFYGQTDQRLVSIIGVTPSRLPEGHLETIDVNINAGDAHAFDCGAIIDEKIATNVRRTWYKDMEQLENDQNSVFYNISYGSVFNNQGEYRCIIETPVDKVEMAWNLIKFRVYGVK